MPSFPKPPRRTKLRPWSKVIRTPAATSPAGRRQDPLLPPPRLLPLCLYLLAYQRDLHSLVSCVYFHWIRRQFQLLLLLR